MNRYSPAGPDRKLTHLLGGFSLIEVLVTVLLIAIALLGLAGLHIQTLRFSHNALVRSHATLFATEIADRMRANLAGVAAGNYDNIDGSQTDPGCITTGCNASQLAAYDGYLWNSTIAAALPQGSGTVTAQGNGVFLITVNWTEQTEAAAVNRNFQMRLRP